MKVPWKTRLHMLKPSIVLGDMNIVKEALDRLPSHNNDTQAVNALTSLKLDLELADGWRRENPTILDFTFQMTNRPIQSRIDRIYVNKDLIPYSWDWQIV